MPARQDTAREFHLRFELNRFSDALITKPDADVVVYRDAAKQRMAQKSLNGKRHDGKNCEPASVMDF
jgi:hypothetical protein